MTISAVLFAVMLVLFAVGVYLLLDRSLTRMLLGFLLVGNGTNLLLLLMSNGFGSAPFAGAEAAGETTDPLPQAFILTSIVITFAVSAFILALIYRSWMLARAAEDEVADDEHDVRLADAEHLSTDEVTGAELAGTVENDEGVSGSGDELRAAVAASPESQAEPKHVNGVEQTSTTVHNGVVGP